MADFDLVLTRDVPVPASHLWKGWTDAETLMKWFCPLPYLTIAASIDLRPGGEFSTTMQAPDGTVMPGGSGCWLVVEPERRLVWTSALGPDFVPLTVEPQIGDDQTANWFFSCELTFEPTATGSRYTARAIHPSAAVRDQHEHMGFFDGWGAALDQLIALY